MKHAILVFGIIVCSIISFGQKTDSTAKDHFPHHFISINPINVCLIQQAGLGYEYRYKRFGFGVTTGYVYASHFNVGRLFLAATANYGAFEFYRGFFCNPQVNFYLKNPKRLKRNTIGYVALKGVYKYMFLDSTRFHIWDNTNGDDYDLYRKQIDRCHIGGMFVNIGFKHVSGNFLIDFSIGPGFLMQTHNIIVVGQTSQYGGNYTSNVHPPRKEGWSRLYPTVNFSFTLGGAF